ncbi:MAG TPA: hypothetical protein VK604_02985 [Bryobacteraceae bacterium]|nr:hypothetical protein [Bryobacteraceae bacterium]
MTENTVSTPDIQAPGRDTSGRVSIWQLWSAKGETIWTWIAWAFAAYWILFTAGAFLNRRGLNELGGALILCILVWAVVDRLWVRVDAVSIASMATLSLSLLQVIWSREPESVGSFIKYASLCLVMALSRLLRLPAASSSKTRWALAAQTLIILIISLTIFRGGSWDGNTRHSGLFPNPNNLALIPLLLLFLVNRNDRLIIRIGAHAMVVVVLAFSGTSGAMVAYAIGLTVHLISGLSRNARFLATWLAVFGCVVAITLVAVGADQFLPDTRLTKQVSVMRTQFTTVFEGGDVAYYAQEKVLGSGSASAVWRLMHWRRTLGVYSEGTVVQELIGFGPGSSVSILGVLPHNEYLRLLFEEGIVGFSLFMFAWYRMITTAPLGVRYVGLILAIYSFSENNLDNFPFMSLFILCLSAGVATKPLGPRSGRMLEPAWPAAGQRA